MVLLSDPGNASSFCISAPRTFVSGSIEIVTLFGSSTLDRTKISVSTTLGLDYGAVITGDGISQQLHTECAGVQRGTVPWFPDLDRFVRLRASAPNMLVVETSPMGMAPWRIVGDCMIPDGFASMRFVVGADRGRGSSGSEVAELDTLELCPK